MEGGVFSPPPEDIKGKVVLMKFVLIGMTTTWSAKWASSSPQRIGVVV